MHKELMKYDEFVDMCKDKDLSMQYHFTQVSENSDKYYELFAIDGMIKYECHINSIDTSTGVSDFEAKYKDDANKPLIIKDEFGSEIVAPTLENVRGYYPKRKMYKHVVTAGTLNFFDLEVIPEKRISGGEYWISPDDTGKVHNDDYVEFSVVDKNDVLGYFSLYGLEVGVDVLELTKFIQTDYIRKGDPADGFHSILYEGTKGTNRVVQGLFFRVAYDSSGTEDLTFLWRLYYYE